MDKQQQAQQRDTTYSASENTTSPQQDHKPPSEREIAPGSIIERGNTPRVFTQAQQMHSMQHTQQAQYAPFPTRAPSAPPLPEEESEHVEQPLNAGETLPFPAPVIYSEQGGQEFLWLFEYGLEMDSSYLNHPQRLNGLALPYGPAILKGYRLASGTLDSIQHNTLANEQATQTYITLLPDQSEHAQVWGFLYRIPRRLLQRSDEQPAPLDSVHHAYKTHALYHREDVRVHETLRGRDIPCVTYTLTAHAKKQLRVLTEAEREHNKTIQTLASIASEKKFPKHYIQTWFTSSTPLIAPTSPPPAPTIAPSQPTHKETLVIQAAAQVPQTPQEQNTEPLRLFKEQQRSSERDKVQRIPLARPETPRLVMIAIYQLLLLLGALSLLILQGLGLLDTPTMTFQALTVPWLILVYGLLGGSISGIVALARNHRHYQGPILHVIWLVRPFIGSVFALLAYLLLNSGLLSFNFGATRYSALCLLISTIAGFGEGWLFRRI